ncbi:uncharacterized protein ISCGN_008115 [Ixodes scapularis]
MQQVTENVVTHALALPEKDRFFLKKELMAKQYAVVHFTEEDHVSAVPISWLVVDKWSCLWPKDFAGSRLLDAIRDKIDPGANWDRYPVRVLTKCKTYKKALKKSRLAEETSTLETSEFSAPEAETPEDVFTTYDDAPSHRLALPSPRLPPKRAWHIFSGSQSSCQRHDV